MDENEKVMTEETVVKESFFKKHKKGIKRGAGILGGIGALVIGALVLNKKKTSDDDRYADARMYSDTDPNAADSDL